MGNAAVKGLVYENEELEWIPTTLWDEKTPNPVNIKVNKCVFCFDSVNPVLFTQSADRWELMTRSLG